MNGNDVLIVAVAGIPHSAGHFAVADGRLLHHELPPSGRTQQETRPGQQIRRRPRHQMQHRKCKVLK